MADNDQLALLKKSVEEWNAWREAHPDVKVDLKEAGLSRANLRGVDLVGADLVGADLRGADLRGADLRGADLMRYNKAPRVDPPTPPQIINTNLTGANLSGADLTGANLRRALLGRANLSGAVLIRANLHSAYLERADLRGADLTNARLSLAGLMFADLRGTNLSNVDLSNTNLSGAKRDAPSSNSATSEPHPSQSSSSADWLSLVETYGNNLFLTAASLASIIQGLDVVERRWREHQAKRKDQQEGAAQNQLPTHTAQAPQPSEREITDILLILDDGSDRELKQWVSDPDTLRFYIEAFTDPESGVKPLQVVFTKRVGRSLVAKARDERDVQGKGSQEISNVILEYLDADPL